MVDFPWLPIGTAVSAGITTGRVLRCGSGWQVLCTINAEGVVLLLDPTAGAVPPWWADEVATAKEALGSFAVSTGDKSFLARIDDTHDAPFTLSELALRNPSISAGELDGLVEALEAASLRRSAGWASAVFVPSARFVILTAELGGENRRATIMGVISGGATDPGLAPARIRALNPWLTAAEIINALRRLNLGTPAASGRRARTRPAEAFSLPGQPQLERILRERILDVAHRPDTYSALGVGMPNGVLLSGPPGAGKSFAARQLADFLGWPLYELNVGSVGSSLLHETPRRIAQVFEDAASHAPAIVLLEEIDAIGGSRDQTHSAGVEEVNTLLREIESAASRGVLAIAMTNRKAALDPALMRRGRFDVVCELGYGDGAQIQAMLDSLLAERPCVPGLNTASFAGRLSGRPASDVAGVVDEAARQAARAGKRAIDDVALGNAARSILAGRADGA